MLNPVTAKFTSQLQSLLPAAAFPELGDKYLTEPRGHYQGSAGLLVAPDSTAQVAQVIAAAAAARIGVVPYGGGTGLVGHPHPPPGRARGGGGGERGSAR